MIDFKKWQTIENAPKTGESILVRIVEYGEYCYEVIHWYGYWDDGLIVTGKLIR